MISKEKLGKGDIKWYRGWANKGRVKSVWLVCRWLIGKPTDSLVSLLVVMMHGWLLMGWIGADQ